MNNIRMLCPASIDELVSALGESTPKSKIIAGGTDLTIAMHEGAVEPDLLISVCDTREMLEIRLLDEKLSIGAAAVYSDIASCGMVKRYFPALIQAASGVGSKQIRNRGTMGGNIANGSPAADMLPVLTALGAEAVTINSRGVTKRRTVKEIISRSSGGLSWDEAIVSFEIPLPRGGYTNAFVKLGSRRTVSIARLNAAFCGKVTDGREIEDALIILGALGKEPVTAHNAMRVLEGGTMCGALEADFMKAMTAEVDKAIPGRYSQQYKREAVKGLALDLLATIRSNIDAEIK